jgi:hypothetical protein
MARAVLDYTLLNSAFVDHATVILSRGTSIEAKRIRALVSLFPLIVILLGRKSPGEIAIHSRLRYRTKLFYAAADAIAAITVALKASMCGGRYISAVVNAAEVLRALVLFAILFSVPSGDVQRSGSNDETLVRHGALSSVFTHTAFRALSDASTALRATIEWREMMGALVRASHRALHFVIRSRVAGALGDGASASLRNNSGALTRSATASSACAYCGLHPPCMPLVAACQHVFCYFCLACSTADQDSGESHGRGSCPVCSASLSALSVPSRHETVHERRTSDSY